MLTRGLWGPVDRITTALRVGGGPLTFVVAVALIRSVWLALAANRRAQTFLSLWPIDLANINQAIWNTAHGRPYFNTIFYEAPRGHFDPVLMLLSPVYLVTDSMLGVFLLYSLIIGSGAVAVYLIAKEALSDDILPALLALYYLTFPPLTELTVLQIRGEVLAVPLLLFSYYFYSSRRFTGFAVFGALSLLCKETIAVLMILWGGLALLQRRRPRWIAPPVSAGAAVLVFTLFIYHPHIQGFAYKHTALMKSSPSLGPGLVLHPAPWLFLLREYFVLYGLIALLSPAPLLLASPFLAGSFVWRDVIQHELWFHCFAPAYPFLFAAVTSATARLSNRFADREPVKPVLAIALAASCTAMVVQSRHLYGLPEPTPEDRAILELIHRIPDDVSVAAPPLVLPPLSNRAVLRSLIIKDRRGAHIDPINVDYVLLSRKVPPWSRMLTTRKTATLDREYRKAVDTVTSGTGFELVDRHQGWELYHREEP